MSEIISEMLSFNEPIIYGRLLKRYKRFFMDVVLDNGDVIVAHVPNTGSLLGVLQKDARVMLLCHDNPARRLNFTALAIEIDNHWVGINTYLPNKLVRVSLAHPLLMELNDYSEVKAEKIYGKDSRSRVDYYFFESKTNEPPTYLEIKNVTLKNGDHAQFPDSPSIRAQKHMKDLMHELKQGSKAMLLFIIQRTDCRFFSAAAHIDKAYSDLLYQAKMNGLNIKALSAQIDGTGLKLGNELDILY